MKFLPVLVFFSILFAAPIGVSAQETDKSSFDPAYTHVVYFWLHNPDDPDDRRAFESALRKLLATSRYTKTNYVGVPPKATREVVDDSFTYTMIVTFDSADSQDAYQREQVHLDFISEAGHLWKKVVVYDAMGLAPH